MLSAASLVSRTPSSLKKRRVPLCLFQGHSRFETVQGRHNYLQFAAIFAPSHGPICMKISVNVQNLMLNIMYIMLYPSKMQGEAKKGVEAHI